MANAREDLTLDVVIPTFNAAPFIGTAIESVLRQETPPGRVIVVDDGSTDDTLLEVAHFRQRVEVLELKANLGGNVARNRGIAACSAPLVALLDADDAWKSTKLTIQLKEFAAAPEIGICFCGHVNCDADLNPSLAVRRPPLLRAAWVFEELFLTSFTMPPSTVVLLREAFHKVGGFNETMRKAQDFELWLRMTMRYPISAVPEPLVLRRIHEHSLTTQANYELTVASDFAAFDNCAAEAAQLGIPLPLPLRRRKAITLIRRMRLACEMGNWESARWCLSRLRKNGHVLRSELAGLTFYYNWQRCKHLGKRLLPRSPTA